LTGTHTINISSIYSTYNTTLINIKLNESENTTNENATDVELPQIYTLFSTYYAFTGEPLSLLAKLIYANNTPIQNSKLTYKENETSLGYNYTNATGWSRFNLNTTNLTGTHTINISSIYSTYNTTTINIKLNESENKTKQNATNQTSIPFQINEITMQGKATIGEPVLWTKEITLKNPNNKSKQANLNVSFPESSSNKTLKKEEENPKKTETVSVSEKVKLSSKKYNISDMLEPNQTKKYIFQYQTSPPKKKEILTKKGKRIIVYSDESIHYRNITAHTNIPELKYQPKLFRIVEDQRIDVTDNPLYGVVYLDTDSDNLYDKIEWNVPQLSNDTYEIDLIILNVQSYPTVGGNWTVKFNTTGVANLTISAVDGTIWSSVNETEDLKFLQIKCGEEILNHSWIDDSVFVESYSCNQTGYEISKVLTSGSHHLLFDFGGLNESAHNWAKEGMIYNCSNCSDCTAAIADASAGDIIRLNTSLTGIDTTCVDFDGKDNVTFDCQNNYINGTDTASTYGIYLSNANGGSNYTTIRNCNISNFY
ncbi:MAG: hypothetical protein KAQ92_04630, partial [Candidatus Aenigmarchaeota archaeon]|nr:hypothetical protein [Candidatus Aenigmarchaeota archaeon]